MHRGPKLLVLVGVFLVVSVLWPYDPGAKSGAPPAHRVAPYDFAEIPAPSTLDFVDDWGSDSSKLLLVHRGSVPPSTVAQPHVRMSVPAGVRVLPGTDELVVTTTLSGAVDPRAALDLEFRAANDAYRRVPLFLDRANRIDVDEAMNDWSPDPHSRWQFWLASRSAAPLQVDVTVEIVRAPGALPGFVEYDARWGKQDVVLAWDQKGSLFDARVGPSGGANGLQTPSEAPAMRMIPPRGVGELHIVLAYNSSSPTDLHYRPSLSYRGADKENPYWEEQGAPPTQALRQQRDGRFEWTLPVEPRMWDSPFAERTRWDVVVNWRGDNGDAPVYMEGDYHFFIEVRRGAFE